MVNMETGMGLVIEQQKWKNNGDVYLVDLDCSKVRTTVKVSYGKCARFSPDGGKFVCLENQDIVKICTLDGTEVLRFKAMEVSDAEEVVCSWTKSGIWLAYAVPDIHLYNPRDGSLLKTLHVGDGKWRGKHVCLDETAVGGQQVDPCQRGLASLLDDNNRKLDFGNGCGVCPSPNGLLFTQNLWENGRAHQTMKIRDRSLNTLQYLHLFDILPYPRKESGGWCWNNQKWSSNSNDIILISVGKSFPQFTDTVIPWIYNYKTGVCHCLNVNPRSSGLRMLHDFYEGRLSSAEGEG